MTPTNGVFHEEAAAIVPIAPPEIAHALAIQRAPNVVLEEATRAAKALQAIIEAKPRKIVLNGKTYLQFEDWQTLGRFYGVTAVARSTKYVEFGEGKNVIRGFEASADALLVGPDQVISAAEALCLDDETNWSHKPLYQLKSMAQTRACAKALRNVLAWVVVLAGYAPTPAEEMDSVTRSHPAPTPQAPVQSVPQTRCKEFCERMQKAGSKDQLREIFRAAYSEASASNDREAQEIYIQTKDARLRELR